MSANNEDITEEDMKEFTRLVEMGESRRQMDRITSRLEFPAFIEKHTKEKCDRMFAILTGKEPA